METMTQSPMFAFRPALRSHDVFFPTVKTFSNYSGVSGVSKHLSLQEMYDQKVWMQPPGRFQADAESNRAVPALHFHHQSF